MQEHFRTTTLRPGILPYQLSQQTQPCPLRAAVLCTRDAPLGSCVCCLVLSLLPGERDRLGFFSDPRAQHGSGTEQGASGEEVKDKVTVLDLTISLKKSS